jgi:hypothetical protein
MQLPRPPFTVGWVMVLAPFLICASFALSLLVPRRVGHLSSLRPARWFDTTHLLRRNPCRGPIGLLAGDSAGAVATGRRGQKAQAMKFS